MGLFSGIIGNASKINNDEVIKNFSFLFGPGEEVEVCYKLIRDQIIFTNRRLILVDIQGITGKKVEYLSIPYSSIVRFSVESMGHLDLDSELKLWVKGQDFPITKQFSKNSNIFEAQSVLAAAIARE